MRASLIAVFILVAVLSLGRFNSEPRFKNVLRINVTAPRAASCYSPTSGHYPCLEVGVVVVFRMNSGREASVSTSYKLEGDVLSAMKKDFGPASPTAIRSLEPALNIGALDPNPAIRNQVNDVLRQAGTTRNYEVGSDITLPFPIESKISLIADEHRRMTGKSLVITSGTRTPESQADAMYVKLQLGDDLTRLYRDQSLVSQIKSAYDTAVASGKTPEQTKAAMADTIRSQVAAQKFISKHLRGGAVDIRSRTMTDPAERRAFEEIVSRTPGVQIGPEETKPPHYHLDVTP